MPQTVISEVKAADGFTFGTTEQFGWAVTREQALKALNYFIDIRLKTVGPYQDAMVTAEDTMWHALLSAYLNLGLFSP